MKNFNQRSDSRGGGGFRSGGGRGFGGRSGSSRGGFDRDRGDRGPAMMHEAVCAECGKNCEVPFRPSGDKPVYCSDCFGSRRDTGDRAPRREFGGGRPSFSNDAPERSRERQGGNDETKRQFETLTHKIDQLTRSIDQLIANGTKAKAEAKRDVEIKAVVKEATTNPASSRGTAKGGGKTTAPKAKAEPKKKVAVKKAKKK